MFPCFSSVVPFTCALVALLQHGGSHQDSEMLVYLVVMNLTARILHQGLLSPKCLVELPEAYDALQRQTKPHVQEGTERKLNLARVNQSAPGQRKRPSTISSWLEMLPEQATRTLWASIKGTFTSSTLAG